MQPERVAREVADWLGGRIPAGWFTAPPEVLVDGEEVLVVGALPDDPDPEQAALRFREDTREQRIRLAAELQRRWRRKVSWGVACRRGGPARSTACPPATAAGRCGPPPPRPGWRGRSRAGAGGPARPGRRRWAARRSARRSRPRPPGPAAP